MACGSFLLTDRYIEFDMLGFKDGEHLVIYEDLDDLKEKIINGASAAEIKKTAIQLGMKTLRMSGLTKITEGVTTIEEVLRVTFSD